MKYVISHVKIWQLRPKWHPRLHFYITHISNGKRAFEFANARKCLRFVLGRNSLYCKIRSFRLCIYYIYIDWKELFMFLRAIYVSAVRTAGYRPLRDQSECSILADGPLRNTGHIINICYSPMYIILKSQA